MNCLGPGKSHPLMAISRNRLPGWRKKRKVLTVPLAKPEQERIQRTVAYEASSKEVSKWDPVVKKNRLAEQLHFPLEKSDLKIVETASQFVKKFKPRTPLELEVSKLLHGNDNVLHNKQMLTPAEERALQAMSVEEAKERRAELQKYRALLSYKQAKAHRQKKIKSKGFHRILRKEKAKQEKTDVEKLQHTDPEAFEDRLLQMDKIRMEERMTLKHRGGSKFSQSQKIFAKYSDSARQAVQDMIQKNKELTQKRAQDSSSGEGSDDETETLKGGEIPENELQTLRNKYKNPWMVDNVTVAQTDRLTKLTAVTNPDATRETESNLLEHKPNTEQKDTVNNSKLNADVSSSESENEADLDEIFSTLEKDKQNVCLKAQSKAKSNTTRRRNRKAKSKATRSKKNKKDLSSKKKPAKRRRTDSNSDETSGLSECEKEDGKVHNITNPTTEGRKMDEGLLIGSLTRRKDLSDFDGAWDEEENKDMSSTIPSKTINKNLNNATPVSIQVDPKKFMTVESTIKQPVTANLIQEEDGSLLTGEQEQRMTIAQAFATDDVVEEFKQEKRKVADRDKPKDIDLTLPGWGDWGGGGLQPSKKKRRRFLVKAPAAPPRKDRNLNNVIISETKDTTISKHQVNDVPFPFTSVHQFEASVRQPIGKTWNPETSYRQLIKPKIVTRMGTIITPIDGSVAFKNSKKKML